MKRILVVDDVVANRMLLNAYLENPNYEVVEAEDGEQAVKKAEEKDFDLILMDMDMPIMNGYEASSKIKHEMKKDTPIIICTASVEDNGSWKEHGIDGFYTKPILAETIGEITNKYL